MHREKQNHGRLSKVCAVLALWLIGIIVVFGYLIPDSADQYFYALVTLLLALSVAFGKDRRFLISINIALWFSFWLYCTLSGLAIGTSPTFFKAVSMDLLCILAAWFVMSIDNIAPSFLLKIVLALSAIHVVATIAQFFFPSEVSLICEKILNPEQYLQNQKLLFDGRYAGITGQTGTNGYCIAICVLASACYITFEQDVRKRRFLVLLLILSCAALMLTQKRTLTFAAYLCVILILGSYFGLQQKQYIRLIFILLVAICAFFIFVNVVPQAQSAFQRFFNGNSSGRDVIIENMLSKWSEGNVAIGIGTGGWDQTADCDYVHILCNNGIIGLALLLVAVYYPIVKLLQSLQFLRESGVVADESAQGYVVMLRFSLMWNIVCAIYAFTGDPYTYNYQFLFVLIIASFGLSASRVLSSKDVGLRK